MTLLSLLGPIEPVTTRYWDQSAPHTMNSSHATDPEASSPLVPAETRQSVPQLCLCGIKQESPSEHFCLTAAQTAFVPHVLLWVAIMMSLDYLPLLLQLEFIHVGRCVYGKWLEIGHELAYSLKCGTKSSCVVQGHVRFCSGNVFPEAPLTDHCRFFFY